MRSAIPLLLLCWSALGLEPSPRSAGLFFDADGGSQFTQLEPFEPRTLFLVAFEFQEISAWEAQLGFSDPSFQVLATRLAPVGASNAGDAANWFVDLGQCLEIPARLTLLEVDFAWWAPGPVPQRSVVCLAPAMPTSVFPPWPAYRDCAGDAFLIDFDDRHPLLLFEACAGINFPVLVATQALGFGALKGRY